MGCFNPDPYPNDRFLAVIWTMYNEFCFYVREMNEREIYFAVTFLIINIFHVAVLTRKKLRSHPIYIIMAAIAILDICSLWYSVHRSIIRIFKVFQICFSKRTDYVLLWIQIFLDCSRNYTRRCSTWLSFSITVIRTLVIRYPLHRKFEILSKPKIAYYLIIGICFFCSLIHIIDPFRYEITRVEGKYYCDQRSLHEYYWFGDTELIWKNEYFVAKIIKIVDGLISRLIPFILFTIATYFLIQEIRKAEKQRQAMSSGAEVKASKNTSNLVLALTLSFFVAGFPLGVVCVLSPFSPSSKSPDDGFVMYIVLSTMEDFFSNIMNMSTAAHMVICVLMSTQYRDCFLKIIRFGYVPERKGQESTVTAESRIQN